MPSNTVQERTIVMHGNAGAAAVAHARGRLVDALGNVTETVGPVYVRLTATPERRGQPVAEAEVHVDIAGGTICAHAAGPTLGIAIDLLHDRLRSQVEERADRRPDQHRVRSASAHSERPGR
jgi:ribosome-associated translation inhibitor RaiA